MATALQIEKNVRKLVENFTNDEFIFELLSSYDVGNSRISRLRNGERNKLESIGELDAATLKLFFKISTSNELHAVIDELSSKYKSEKKPPRFAIVTDYKTLLAVDTKTDDTLDVAIKDLAKHYDFFLPLAGMEKAQIVNENPADVKAAEKMAKLYDEITKDNEIKSKEEVHALNVFLTRLLFCYFAEDSNIFADNQFTNAIEQHTQDDGSDLDEYIIRVFELLDTEKRDSNLSEHLKAFPYVNGGLFRTRCKVPKFTSKSRRIMIEVGTLDWSDINPDIFGSMIQAVITDEHRGGMGMHYTSVPNIMKVIEPLFLDPLYEEFENSKTSKAKLQKLKERLANLKIFDPACGSGNFLIIAYKELRALEIMILQQIDKVSNMKQGEMFNTQRKKEQMSFMSLSSNIKLTQFYGIELDDFAHEVAILSLWLTEHQMNVAFFKEFGQTAPPLPLPEGGHIVHGNATRLDWEEVCPKEEGDEIYILGNPPYVGSRMQTIEQKEDLEFICGSFPKYKTLDYVSIWFVKGTKYITNYNSKLSFVSTNSICQGEQVALLWKNILNHTNEIFFAYQSFHWTNNAKGNAGVTVVIVGLQNTSSTQKLIYTKTRKYLVKNINPYLLSGKTIYLLNRQSSTSNLPAISAGNYTGHALTLSLSDMEKDILLQEYPQADVLIKKLLGSKEFIHNESRWCLWIHHNQRKFAETIPPIRDRIEKVKIARLASKDKSANLFANRPHQYRDTKETTTTSVIIPTVSSERRNYIPIGFINSDVIVSNRNHIIYNTEVYIFAIVCSGMHNLWVKTVAGRMRLDINYSSDMCYNNFPFPNISEKQKEQLSKHVFNILDEREQHSEKTLAQLYDPEKMPEGLRQSHHNLDLAIEQCYRKKPFTSDEERLEYLFGLYVEMIANEN